MLSYFFLYRFFFMGVAGRGRKGTWTENGAVAAGAGGGVNGKQKKTQIFIYSRTHTHTHTHSEHTHTHTHCTFCVMRGEPVHLVHLTQISYREVNIDNDDNKQRDTIQVHNTINSVCVCVCVTVRIDVRIFYSTFIITYY